MSSLPPRMGLSFYSWMSQMAPSLGLPQPLKPPKMASSFVLRMATETSARESIGLPVMRKLHPCLSPSSKHSIDPQQFLSQPAITKILLPRAIVPWLYLASLMLGRSSQQFYYISSADTSLIAVKSPRSPPLSITLELPQTAIANLFTNLYSGSNCVTIGLSPDGYSSLYTRTHQLSLSSIKMTKSGPTWTTDVNLFTSHGTSFGNEISDTTPVEASKLKTVRFSLSPKGKQQYMTPFTVSLCFDLSKSRIRPHLA